MNISSKSLLEYECTTATFVLCIYDRKHINYCSRVRIVSDVKYYFHDIAVCKVVMSRRGQHHKPTCSAGSAWAFFVSMFSTNSLHCCIFLTRAGNLDHRNSLAREVCFLTKGFLERSSEKQAAGNTQSFLINVFLAT